MAHDRDQHVLEAAGDMRTNGFLDEGAADRSCTATRSDGEVVGPEANEPLAERLIGIDRAGEQRLGFGVEKLAHFTLAGRRLVLAIGFQRRQAARGAGREVRSGGVRIPVVKFVP
jgi:hypothetical protein